MKRRASVRLTDGQCLYVPSFDRSSGVVCKIKIASVVPKSNTEKDY